MDGVEGPLLALTLVLMVVGLLGSVLPGLPGVTLIFLSALVYAALTDFRTVGVAILAVLFVLAAIAFVADFVATSYGARRFGASNWGTVGGAVGRVLPAFSHEDEAEMFLWFGYALEDGWHVRETSAGELATLLCGPCADVGGVALDPLPGMAEAGTVDLVSVDRKRFVRRIVAGGEGRPIAAPGQGRGSQ